MSNSLRQLQLQLQAKLLRDSHAIDRTIAAYNPRRMAVYTEGYYSRLCEVLRDDFPGLEHILGAKQFNALARAYIQHIPSQYASVRHVGKHLLGFVVNQSQYNRLAVREMVQLEWAIVDALDSVDATPVSIEFLKKVPPEQWPMMQFTFHSSHQLVPLLTNAIAVWRAVNRHDELIPKLVEAGQPTVWSVWRYGIRVKFYQHPEDEAAVLQAACKGCAFAELSKLLCAWHVVEEVPKVMLGYLMNWIQGGIVTDLEF